MDMTNHSTHTPGQAFTTEIRAMYQIGPRTRWNRKTGRIVKREHILRDTREAIGEYRGIESERRTAILDTAHIALAAYSKFIENYRIDGLLRHEIVDQSPWNWTAYLGRMIDAGCTNMAEFENWFANEKQALYTREVVAA